MNIIKSTALNSLKTFKFLFIISIINFYGNIMNKQEQLKELMSKLPTDLVNRLLDIDPNILSKAISVKHDELDSFVNLPDNVRSKMISLANTLNDNSQGFDSFEFDSISKGRELFHEINKEKVKKISKSSEDDYLLNNKKK